MDKNDMTDYKKLIEEYYSADISAERLSRLRRATEEDPDGDPEFEVLRRIFRMEEEGRRNLMSLAPEDMEERIIRQIRMNAGIRKGRISRKRMIMFMSVASVAAVIAILFGLGVRLSDPGHDAPSGKELFADRQTGYKEAPASISVREETSLPSEESLAGKDATEPGRTVRPAHHGKSTLSVGATDSDESIAEPVDPEQIEESYAVLNECFALLGEAFSEARGEYSESVSQLDYDEVVRHL